MWLLLVMKIRNSKKFKEGYEMDYEDMNKIIVNGIRIKRQLKGQLLLLVIFYILLAFSSWQLTLEYGIYGHNNLTFNVLLILIVILISFEDIIAKIVQLKGYNYSPLFSGKVIFIMWLLVFNYNYFAPLLIPSIVVYLLFRKSYNYQKNQATEYSNSVVEIANFKLGVSGKVYSICYFTVAILYIVNFVSGYTDSLGTTMILIGGLGLIFMRKKGIDSIYINYLSNLSEVTTPIDSNVQEKKSNVHSEFNPEASESKDYRNKMFITLIMTIILFAVAIFTNKVIVYEISIFFVGYSILMIVLYIRNLKS